MLKFIHDLKACPKVYDYLEFDIVGVTRFKGLPAFTAVRICAVKQDIKPENPDIKIELAETAFYVCDVPGSLIPFAYYPKFKATIKTVPVPQKGYRVRIHNPFSWGIYSGLVKAPTRRYRTELEKNNLILTKKPWEFSYVENSEWLAQITKWFYEDYLPRKKYWKQASTAQSDYVEQLSRQEIARRGALGYV